MWKRLTLSKYHRAAVLGMDKKILAEPGLFQPTAPHKSFLSFFEQRLADDLSLP